MGMWGIRLPGGSWPVWTLFCEHVWYKTETSLLRRLAKSIVFLRRRNFYFVGIFFKWVEILQFLFFKISWIGLFMLKWIYFFILWHLFGLMLGFCYLDKILGTNNLGGTCVILPHTMWDFSPRVACSLAVGLRQSWNMKLGHGGESWSCEGAREHQGPGTSYVL